MWCVFVWCKAREDFMQRVKAYEKVYETIEDHEDNGNVRCLGGGGWLKC